MDQKTQQQLPASISFGYGLASDILQRDIADLIIGRPQDLPKSPSTSRIEILSDVDPEKGDEASPPFVENENVELDGDEDEKAPSPAVILHSNRVGEDVDEFDNIDDGEYDYADEMDGGGSSGSLLDEEDEEDEMNLRHDQSSPQPHHPPPPASIRTDLDPERNKTAFDEDGEESLETESDSESALGISSIVEEREGGGKNEATV